MGSLHSSWPASTSSRLSSVSSLRPPKLVALNSSFFALILLLTSQQQSIRQSNTKLAFGNPGSVDKYKAVQHVL